MLNTILFTIGVLLLLESLLILIFPKAMSKTLRKFSSKTKIKKAGVIELVFGLILILVGVLINNL